MTIYRTRCRLWATAALIIAIVSLFVPANTLSTAAGAEEAWILPAEIPGHQIVWYSGYVLSYNEAHEQPDWVAYTLTADELAGPATRTNDYRPDTLIITGSAELADYAKSGYDRGHLAPAADFKWSYQAMSESFLMSNKSPQTPGFNRGIWLRLEREVRDWASANQTIHVVTGPVLTPNAEYAKLNQVTIPTAFYKVILDLTEPELKGIGFVLPNGSSQADLATFAVSIDSVEALTGLDFFPALDDAQEESLESQFNPDLWFFDDLATAEKVRCLGITRSGHQCKRMVSSPDPYCYQHQNQANADSVVTNVDQAQQCQGITQAGNRCQRKTRHASGYCYQHRSQTKAAPSSTKLETAQQCQGTTLAGNQCRRKTRNANGYCYQHQDQAPGTNGETSEVSTSKAEADSTTVYVTPSGTKYHRPNCRYVTNRAKPIPLEKARQAYGPCKVCQPPR